MKDGSEWGHEALTVCVAVHVFAAAAVLIRALVAMDVLGASLLSLFASFSVFICRIAIVGRLVFGLSRACEGLGVARQDLFEPDDLLEQEDLARGGLRERRR